MTANENEELAAGVGQEKSDHEPICVYDKKMGKYEEMKPGIGSLDQSKSTVQPFGSMK